MPGAVLPRDGLWTIGFRRLLLVRLTSQCGDGVFQAGIAWLVLLSPGAQRTPSAFAGVLALLLLPFSVVGPFAGVVLDRWRRRQILYVGQLLRVVAVGAVAVLSSIGGQRGTWLAYTLVLVALGINRLLLAALSASVPYVVPRDRLVDANAIAPTAGTIATGTGLSLGAAVVTTNATSSHALVVSMVVFTTAGLVASRFPAAALGPEAGVRTPRIADAVLDLRAVLGHLRGRVAAAWALIRLGVFRVAFGAWTLWVFAATAGAWDDAIAATTAAATAAGFAAAAVLTPVAARWWSLGPWVLALVLAALAAGLVATAADDTLRWAVQGFGLGVAGQTLKIQTDTIVQRTVDESFLGRAFTVYDGMFNVTFVAGALAAALAHP